VAHICSYLSIPRLFQTLTDTSQDGIGAVLSQIHHRAEIVVAYASLSMIKAEQKYCVTLAVVIFTKLFWPYFLLIGQSFKLQMDRMAP